MKKFKVLGTLLLLATVLSVGMELFNVAPEFKKGWDDDHVETRGDNVSVFYANVVGRGAPLVFNDVDPRTRQIVECVPERMRLTAVVAPTQSGMVAKMLITLVAIAYLCAMFIALTVFVHMARGIRRRELFTPATESGFRWLGGSLLVVYGLEWVFVITTYLYTRDAVCLASYRIVMDDTPSPYPLLVGIGMFIMAQVFVLARQMKEEQELTI